MSNSQLLWAGGIAAALVGIWKVILPISKLIALMDAAIPMLQEQVALFRTQPNGPKILNEIAQQFKSDSGSNLKDQTNRLEASAAALEAAVEQLRIGYEAAKQVAENDRSLTRHQYQQTIVSFDHLTQAMKEVQKEQAAVASDLRLAKAKVAGVAEDLADQHDRADQVEGPPGEAADTAARSGLAAHDRKNG